MTDRYQHWRDNLAGKTVPFHDGDAQPGFYRKRKHKGGPFVPVAIFEIEGEVVCLVDGYPVDAAETWSFVCRNPVSEEAYRAVAERGEAWHDDHAVDPVKAPTAPGSNEPADEATMLADQIESARAGASDYAKVESDEQAAKAQSLRSRLLELSRTADKRRVDLKQPFLDGGKAIDTKWQPLVRAAKETADAIAKAMGTWETEKARKAAEAQRRIDEERRRREEDARAAEEAGKPAPAPALNLEPVPTPPPTTQIRGGYGRAAAVKVVHVITGITDLPALVERYRSAVIVFVTERAQKDIDAGHEVPGVTIEEKRKVA